MARVCAPKSVYIELMLSLQIGKTFQSLAFTEDDFSSLTSK